MQTTKVLARLFGLIAICHCSLADTFTISQPTPIERPPLVSHPERSFNYPTVGVIGTNGIFLWNQPNPGGYNIFATRLDADGQVLDHPGRWLVTRQFGSGAILLVPAESSVFMIYDRKPNESVRTELMLTRLSSAGEKLFEPRLVHTNAPKEYRVASNGRTLMLIHSAFADMTTALFYTLFNAEGATIATGKAEGSDFPMTHDLATDGEDYLVVWQAGRTPSVRAARINGATGVHKVTSLNPSGLGVRALGYGKNGYLLAANTLTTNKFLQLDRDGKIMSEVAAPFEIRPTAAVYPEGESWVVFSMESSGNLRSVRVTPADGGLRVEQNPYPVTTGVSYNGALPSESIIKPFGPGRYLLAKMRGVSVLTAAGTTTPSSPKIYLSQRNGRVAASPFGYLVLWDSRAMRFTKDGTPLDAASFLFTDRSVHPPASLGFDGVDYVIGYQQSNPLGQAVARISPTGPPNVRVRPIMLADPVAPFGMVVHQGRPYYYYSPGLSTEANLYVYRAGPDDAPMTDDVVHGQSIVSDGTTRYSLGSESGQVYLWRINPDAAPVETDRRVIAAGNGAYGASFRNGMAIAWGNEEGWHWAYFTNGVVQYRSLAPAFAPPVFAASDTHLLAAYRASETSQRIAFRAVNLRTGERFSTGADLGPVLGFDIASAGTDFLGVIDTFNLDMTFVSTFWVTPTPQPAFALTPRIEGGATASLALQPARRYRIETSTDLINWQLLETLTARDRFEVPSPSGDRTFVRALLVPE